MVTLFVDDTDQLTMLEYLLMQAKIEYEVKQSDGRYGIETPYLIVYGVPLDEKRAYYWIKEQGYE